MPARYGADACPGEQVNPARAGARADFIGSYSKMKSAAEQTTAAALARAQKGLPEKPLLKSRPAPLVAVEAARGASAPGGGDASGRTDSALARVDDAVASSTPASSRTAPRADESERLPAIPSAAQSSRFLSAQSVAASDALQTASIRSAFERDVPSSFADSDLFFRGPAPAPAADAAASTAASTATRRRNPKKYLVAKKMKQKDRIADDYYELLRQVA